MSESLLTPEQATIVAADLVGPRLVDAGAGTGKTFTLVARALALVERGALTPDQLLVLTFTKAAANEIAGRLESAFAPTEHRRPVCGTFHGIAGDLIREFAYEAGLSPDIRVIDDGRARGLFARAFADLQGGRIDVDLSAFPLLERSDALERSLATLALTLKQQGVDVSEAIKRARDAASKLESLGFGGTKQLGKKGGLLADWPKPNPERSSDERRAEAARERLNVDVVAALLARFQKYLDAESLFTFGDVIVRATKMLRDHPAIATIVRRRWLHAIVDEFQDTNRSQVAFLEALFGDELRQVFVVGDVRQAIYEFNGADPRGIVDFRSRARETLPLTLNRRSVQPILDVAHYALGTLGGVDSALNSPLLAHRGEAEPARVCVELFEGPDGLEREAAAVAQRIRGLVDSGVAPRECAVLLRTRKRINIFAAALRSRSLAVALHGGVGFFDAPEIREVVAWLRIADDPTNPFAVVAALQSAAIGLGDGAVAQLAKNNEVARAAFFEPSPSQFSDREIERLERFRQTARIVCSLGNVRLVDAVRGAIAASGAEVARLHVEDLPQVRANLEKLVRLSADFAGDRPMARIRDFVGELREREELDLDLPIAELDGDRVSIMTIHGAKGLEWDHVFVANVSAGTFPLNANDRRDVVVKLDPKSGALAIKAGIDGRPTLRWYLTQYSHNDEGVIEAKERSDRSEEFRLLYVALTRARDRVYLTGRRAENNQVSKCLEEISAWAIAKSGDLLAHRVSAPADTDSISARSSELPDSDLQLTLLSRMTRLAEPHIPLERVGVLSYTAIELHERCPRRARYHYVLGLPELADESATGSHWHDGEEREPRDPARYGRVVHKALELLAIGRIQDDEIGVEAAVAEAASEEGGAFSLAQMASIQTEVESAHNALAELTPLHAERHFEIDIDGTKIGGYIDLIALDRDGQPLIVDYKTGKTPAHHYVVQFALYGYAVRDEYPTAQARLLRIGDGNAAFEAIVPASEDELRAAVSSAASMSSDEPRPGVQCGYCPYAHDVCDAGSTEIGTASRGAGSG